MEFVGVWGRNPAKAAALAGEYGAQPYAEVDALIADVDAIAIALPPDVQAPIALRAARAGKHLLLDKPVAFTTAEADEIVAAVGRARPGLGGVLHPPASCRRSQQFVAEARGDRRLAGGAGSTTSARSSTPGNPFGASPWRKRERRPVGRRPARGRAGPAGARPGRPR